MKQYPLLLFISFFVIGTGVSCKTSYKTSSVRHHSYSITDSLEKDRSFIPFLSVYRDSLQKKMSQIIGTVPSTLESGRPESTLGNFMTDAMLTMAIEKFKTHVDASFMNPGGIRLSQIPAGSLTTGKIYEIMPFDNIIVVLKIKGSVLIEFLQLIASHRGWPVAGITYKVKERKAIDIIIRDKPIDPVEEYTIAIPDFIANGGENADMLKPIPQISMGYLYRDAIFDYIKKLNAEGKPIGAKLENRVSYVE